MGKKASKRVVLAEGEVTGHMHVAEGIDLDFAENILSAPSGAEVTHQEHKTRTLPPGKYDIRQVQELDPAGDVRNVAD